MVYHVLMRTNIDLDDRLVDEAMSLTGERTKRAVVLRGLEALIRLERLRKVRDARGTLKWEGDLARMREQEAHDDRPARRHQRAH
jgi:Arc/MetJ family transcription regulator